jgi:hypothetical protein
MDTLGHPDASPETLLRQHQTPVGGGGVLMRRALIDRIGFWNTDYKYVPDTDFYFRAALVTEFVFVPRALVKLRVHEGSITMGHGLDMARERVRWIEDVYARDDLPQSIRDMRTAAYRSAFITAAVVAGPGMNQSDERYFVADSMGRSVSEVARNAPLEAGLATAQAEFERASRERDRVEEDNRNLRELLAGSMGARLYERLRPRGRRILARVAPSTQRFYAAGGKRNRYE